MLIAQKNNIFESDGQCRNPASFRVSWCSSQKTCCEWNSTEKKCVRYFWHTKSACANNPASFSIYNVIPMIIWNPLYVFLETVSTVFLNTSLTEHHCVDRGWEKVLIPLTTSNVMHFSPTSVSEQWWISPTFFATSPVTSASTNSAQVSRRF